MSTHEQPGSIADALRAVEEQRVAAQERHSARLAEVDEEIERLQESIQNLQAQIQTLQESRAQIEQEQDPEFEGGAELIFQVLREHSGRLAERAAMWAEAVAAVEAQKNKALQSPEIAPLVAEYQQFRDGGDAALAQLPPSYRKAIEEVHNKVRDQLRAHLEELDVTPELDAESIPLDVVFSSDEGLVMIITPVSADVYSQWAGRPAGLDTRIAAKIVEGLYTALRGTAAEAAEAVYGGHEGLLAMELEIPLDMSGFPERLQAAMEQTFESAVDIAAARVELRLAKVPVDLLLPADDEEVDDA
ncbi:MAG: hypothetical protein EA397_08325 [Deltaproteobacteria bacterium]|nr:MAG: hypothetical protein EA397_08325 [Deltaproteobacteria bacterium]